MKPSRPFDRKKREKLTRQRQDDDVRELMSTASGRRFVYGLLYGLCGLEGPSAHASGSLTYQNEGRRAVAIELKQTLHRVCPSDFVHMVQEAVSAQQEEALYESSAAETDDGDGDSRRD